MIHSGPPESYRFRHRWPLLTSSGVCILPQTTRDGASTGPTRFVGASEQIYDTNMPSSGHPSMCSSPAPRRHAHICPKTFHLNRQCLSIPQPLSLVIDLDYLSRCCSARLERLAAPGAPPALPQALQRSSPDTSDSCLTAGRGGSHSLFHCNSPGAELFASARGG